LQMQEGLKRYPDVTANSNNRLSEGGERSFISEAHVLCFRRVCPTWANCQRRLNVDPPSLGDRRGKTEPPIALLYRGSARGTFSLADTLARFPQ
jgi:hypothetical protein